MVSIEFSHIYLDENIAFEHIDGKNKVMSLISNYNENEYELVTLIDDYNALQNILDLDDFKNFLNEGLKQKVKVFFESDMILYAPLTLEMLHKDDASSYNRYIIKYNKYPCSLLAMTSYLMRLGLIPSKFNLTKSEILINILSDRFEGVENQIIKQLARSKIKGIEKYVETIYINRSDELYIPQITPTK